MALLYLSKHVDIVSPEPVIRKLEDDGDYAVAIELPMDDDDEDAICEVCLTEDEVVEMYDLLFNR